MSNFCESIACGINVLVRQRMQAARSAPQPAENKHELDAWYAEMKPDVMDALIERGRVCSE